jgi:hypothetical protein
VGKPRVTVDRIGVCGGRRRNRFGAQLEPPADGRIGGEACAVLSFAVAVVIVPFRSRFEEESMPGG